MAKSVLLTGPAGSGKTTLAKHIAAHYGLTDIVDDFAPGQGAIKPEGVLYIAQAALRFNHRAFRQVTIDQAKKALGITKGDKRWERH